MDENSYAGQTSHLPIDLFGNPSFGLAKWYGSLAFNISKNDMCPSKFVEGVDSNIPLKLATRLTPLPTLLDGFGRIHMECDLGWIDIF